MGRLESKVAIVTGAARGNGAAIARALISEGAKVLLGDIRDDLGKAVAKELGDAATYLHMDITQEDDWARAIKRAEHFGQLNVLVNNAAILHIAPIEQTSAEDYMRVVTVNELGTFLGVRSAIEPMRAAGGGSIVNVSSIDGCHPSPGTCAYSASKFAVRGISKVAALELGRYGIRVNSLNPAPGNAEMVRPFLSPEALRRRERERPSEVPLDRVGRMEDVGQAVVFLASDDSCFFHGADFVLDGGITAGMVIPGGIPGDRHAEQLP